MSPVIGTGQGLSVGPVLPFIPQHQGDESRGGEVALVVNCKKKGVVLSA